jgi:hypothetical protein
MGLIKKVWEKVEVFIIPNLHFLFDKSDESTGFQKLFTRLQKAPPDKSDSVTGLVRSKTKFQRLQPGSRGLHQTCPVPGRLPKSFHQIPERSTRLVQ